MASWRDGAAATLQQVTQETPFDELSVPGDVEPGDVLLAVASCFTFTASGPGITLTSPGGEWQQLAAVQDSGADEGLDAYGAVFTRVATAEDAGSALTFAFTGTPGTDEMWWAGAVGAWDGYAAASVVAAAVGLGMAPACPAEDTATAGELPVYLAACAINGSGSVTGVPAGSVQRENAAAAGICAVIADAGTPEADPGASIGGGSFGSPDTGWWTVWTVTLAPALTVTFDSTDGNGVDSYTVSSIYDAAPGTTTLRVLAPASPSGDFGHSFAYALPVAPGLDDTFGDGLDVMAALGVPDMYNMTIIEPTFGIDPWYADAGEQAVSYETFMVLVAAWVAANLAAGGEQHHLIGFSKSGIGGQDLILKHPDVWTRCASWDFPADMDSYDRFGSDSEAGYGTQGNFQGSYELTPDFVAARAAPFTAETRIWISGEALYGSEVADYDALLTAAGVLHDYPAPVARTHNWTSGWVPAAAAFIAGAAPPAGSSQGVLLGVLP